jgi:hypothetical protein
MRVRRADDANIRAAIDAGRVLRTHILRPTWRYCVPRTGPAGILALTSPTVITGMAARHRALDLTPQFVVQRHEQLAALLAGGHHHTRREIEARLGTRQLTGERLAHVWMLAELTGLICSGRTRSRHDRRPQPLDDADPVRDRRCHR